LIVIGGGCGRPFIISGICFGVDAGAETPELGPPRYWDNGLPISQ